jgi:arylsulfatase A-like enzyme
MGLWLGLAYGFVEALEACVLGLIPGALAWRNGNSPDILWVAPLFYAVVFLVVAAAFGGLTFPFPRIKWDVPLVFVLICTGAYLAASLQGQVFAPWACGLLGLGLGWQLTRQYGQRRETCSRLMSRTLPHLAAGVLLLGLLTIGAARLQEALALQGLPAPTGDRPNVLLLVIDTLRADHLSGYGYHRATTPCLDRMARHGLLFEQAYANSSWTLPSHASLLTERFVHEHRAGYAGRPFLSRDHPTLAEILQGHGYATAGFVANCFWCGRQTRLDRGFIRYEDFYGSLGDALTRPVLGRKQAYDLQVPARLGWVDIPGRKRAEQVNQDLLDWLDKIQGRPFFAFVNYLDVHGPYLPPPGYAGLYSGDPRAAYRTRKLEIGAAAEAEHLPPADRLQAWVDAYDESLAYVDRQIGVLRDRLQERGLLDKTIIIVTSDHGEGFGEHDMVYHGNSLYREQIHVPLIIRYPEKVPGGVCERRPVGLDRVPATVVDLVGVRTNVFSHPSLVRDPKAAADGLDVVLSEVSYRPHVPRSWPTSRGWVRSLINERWHCLLLEDDTAELYDHRADPHELHNLATSPKYAEIVADFRGQLDRILRQDLAARFGRAVPLLWGELSLFVQGKRHLPRMSPDGALAYRGWAFD